MPALSRLFSPLWTRCKHPRECLQPSRLPGFIPAVQITHPVPSASLEKRNLTGSAVSSVAITPECTWIEHRLHSTPAGRVTAFHPVAVVGTTQNVLFSDPAAQTFPARSCGCCFIKVSDIFYCSILSVSFFFDAFLIASKPFLTNLFRFRVKSSIRIAFSAPLYLLDSCTRFISAFTFDNSPL